MKFVKRWNIAKPLQVGMNLKDALKIIVIFARSCSNVDDEELT